MATWPDRACTALMVYYERGVHALNCVRKSLWDEVDVVLNLRTAAFHNFRAADYLALQEGYPPELEARLREIWEQIVANDSELMSELVKARRTTETEMTRLVKVKNTLGRFRSGTVQESDWEKPI
jgi:hypothetical protein